MRNLFITIFFISFIVTTCMAQSSSGFIGIWKVTQENESHDLMTLTKHKVNINSDWGKFFQFNNDGTYSEYAYAPCGLDDNHYRYSGKWKFDNVNNTIELFEIKISNDRPNIYMNYQVLSAGTFKILSFNNRNVKIQITNPWEKVSQNEKEK